MHENDARPGLGSDPLAEIIRAAGPRSAPPTEHYDQVFAATRAAWQRKISSRRRRRWFALAASVAGLAFTGALVQLQLATNTILAASIAITQGDVELRLDDSGSWERISGELNLSPGTHLRTASESRAALMLADGGSLRLDIETEIVIGLDHYELVAGTVYFDSDGRAPAKPLAIATNLGTIRDIGTQFEISSSDERLRVRVRSGRIEITDSPFNIEIAGDAGSEIELSANGNSLQKSFAADDPAWRWAESLALPPTSESIFSYLTWIAHETGKRLEFQSRYVELSARNVRLAGDPAGQSPMDIVRLIEDTSNFRFEFKNDGTILIERRIDP
jgi:hypothetical protein